ncbi:vWA domain-containing protein [Haloplasma contractile]|uniref:Magnesium chelatase subunit D protein n=1 Tax=Haloplasma contractile SSD-17B TaxID=1033810 RepID=U2EB55_9MOLU|nr:VWA domain-containing protein [Haloplasma contractile]ERJ12006.1 magnesium chelatase subunit D protein [Haloplasma contractile SSD-17B]
MKLKLIFIIALSSIFLMLSSCSNKEDSAYYEQYSPLTYHNSNVQDEDYSNEDYKHIEENRIMDVLTSPLSTFSIDVDTASYSNMRRFLNDGNMPQPDAIRTEELINYFSYDYNGPTGENPFSITTEVAPCPWNEQRQLAMIGIQGIKIDNEEFPPSNLVFLLDVSGSMNASNKLPLVKDALKLLVNNLDEDDTISIVVYAGSSGVVLEPTSGDQKDKIIRAFEGLQAGGSTAGGTGITRAYQLAKDSFIEGGNNRVILATDGDFNVGVSSDSELTRLIEEKRDDDIFLSVLGFGTGNYKDSKMETLANKGNGNYAYIDSLLEAKKVLVEEMGSTLLTIAKDVKIQVEFNPAQVKGYRLIGYENRLLNNEDFDDDTKDAGELGAGHTVTAFYELIPADSDEDIDGIDDLKYQNRENTGSNEIMEVRIRYKEPTGDESKLITEVVNSEDLTSNPSNNFKFASSVAEFGLLLRDSDYKGTASYTHIIETATASKGDDTGGYRSEFIRLVKLAKELDTRESE